ncbi:hypothetical protein CRC_01985 [Cylindrospermopsis raciborskii CS-505]|nr:hypothetical protein CRC_01985 [Cylindrospermopsis raciborskii CS-505]
MGSIGVCIKHQKVTQGRGSKTPPEIPNSTHLPGNWIKTINHEENQNPS